jgi:MFS family permease
VPGVITYKKSKRKIMAQDDEQDGTSSSAHRNKIPFRLLAPQAFVSFMDSLSYMVTAPSLIFYVTSQGGSYEAYGIIMSIFSFSSFCFKPVLGYWCDKAGGKFRAPYLSTLAISSIGGLVYFCASLFPPGYVAIGMILAGRFLGGMGAANQTLGFTYVAQVVDRKIMTEASAILSLTRIVGLAIAPALNIFLDMIDATIYIGSYPLTLTPLNSVGLFLFFGNLSSLAFIYYTLDEPPPMKKQASSSSNENDDEVVDEGSSKFWESVFCIEILVLLFAVFTMNASWCCYCCCCLGKMNFDVTSPPSQN